MMNDRSEYLSFYKIEDNAIPKLYFLFGIPVCRTFQSSIFKKVDRVAISSEEQNY